MTPFSCRVAVGGQPRGAPSLVPVTDVTAGGPGVASGRRSAEGRGGKGEAPARPATSVGGGQPVGGIKGAWAWTGSALGSRVPKTSPAHPTRPASEVRSAGVEPRRHGMQSMRVKKAPPKTLTFRMYPFDLFSQGLSFFYVSPCVCRFSRAVAERPQNRPLWDWASSRSGTHAIGLRFPIIPR